MKTFREYYEIGTKSYTDHTKKMTPGQNEKLDPKKHDAGDYIKDFRKSKAPQFKGKSKAILSFLAFDLPLN